MLTSRQIVKDEHCNMKLMENKLDQEKCNLTDAGVANVVAKA